MTRGLVALGLGAALFAGCDDGVSPRLEALRFDGQAPDSAAVLLFTMDFEDADGDLGRGVMETYVNGRASGLGALSFEPLFLWNELPLDATEGSLEFVLELSLSETLGEAADFELGVRAVDALLHSSQLQTVRLRVEPR